jgi:hypothetical protein
MSELGVIGDRIEKAKDRSKPYGRCTGHLYTEYPKPKETHDFGDTEGDVVKGLFFLAVFIGFSSLPIAIVYGVAKEYETCGHYVCPGYR